MIIKWNEEEIEFLKNNYSTKGATFCMKKLNKTEAVVRYRANKLGLKINKEAISNIYSKKIIDIGEYINVNNPKIAYILGLIWTDGSIIYSNNKSKTPVIKHSCVKYDSYPITNIFKELNWRHFDSENKKSIGKNTMSTHWLCSRELGNYLISNNYRNKKDGTTIMNNINKNVISHFIRGLFDGDGCFVASDYTNSKYKQFQIVFSSSSNQNWNFLTDFFDILNIKYRKRIITDKLGKSSQLSIHQSQSIFNLCEFMYKDSNDIRLERKYNKYKIFTEYKKLYNNIF